MTPEDITTMRMQYMGVLGLLSEISAHLPNHMEDERDSIERAFEDACKLIPGLSWKRILNHVEIVVL